MFCGSPHSPKTKHWNISEPCKKEWIIEKLKAKEKICAEERKELKIKKLIKVEVTLNRRH